jgi:hypothetical protein
MELKSEHCYLILITIWLFLFEDSESEQTKKQAIKFDSENIANSFIKDNYIADNTECEIIELP